MSLSVSPSRRDLVVGGGERQPRAGRRRRRSPAAWRRIRSTGRSAPAGDAVARQRRRAAARSGRPISSTPRSVSSAARAGRIDAATTTIGVAGRPAGASEARALAALEADWPRRAGRELRRRRASGRAATPVEARARGRPRSRTCVGLARGVDDRGSPRRDVRAARRQLDGAQSQRVVELARRARDWTRRKTKARSPRAARPRRRANASVSRSRSEQAVQALLAQPVAEPAHRLDRLRRPNGRSIFSRR